MKHPGGRPSGYDPNILKDVKDYIVRWIERQELVPSIEGFARYTQWSKNTLYVWAKDHPEFQDALDDIRDEQAFQLINKGLGNQINTVITKLMLSSNHGMAEKSEQKTEHSGRISLSDLFDQAK